MTRANLSRRSLRQSTSIGSWQAPPRAWLGLGFALAATGLAWIQGAGAVAQVGPAPAVPAPGAASAGVAVFPSPVSARTNHLPAPEHISSEILKDLRGRMGRHGNTMSNLVTAVVLLDRPVIQKLARNIADEEIVASVTASSPRRKVTKPLPLPAEFYKQQDTLRTAAQQLALAAVPNGDAQVLADVFANVTRTCVGCHSAYLHGDLQPSATPPPIPKSPPSR